MDDSNSDEDKQLQHTTGSSDADEDEEEQIKPSSLYNQFVLARLQQAHRHMARQVQFIPVVSDKGNSLQNAIEIEDSEPTKKIQHDLTTGTGDAPSSSNFLGLNRKAMEQERLARQSRKRKASISPPAVHESIRSFNDSVAFKHSAENQSSPSSQSWNSLKKKYLNPSNASNASASMKSGPEYLNGVVKKTWAMHHPRGEDIKIEEVLQRNDLTLAVLSSFQWDVEWLLNKLNIKKTQMTFVMQAENDSVKRQYGRETSTMPNLRLCFPSMEGQINCMHSKLMLLSYPTHLRVVIPTGNLVPYDWGETGVMENMVFLIDLPRLTDTKGAMEKMTGFAQELIYFLQAMGLENSMVESIRNLDFSKTEDLAFVHTIGGAHHGPDEPWRRTGFCGLGRAIQTLGLSNDMPLSVNMVTSSIGALNMDFLVNLYLATKGDDGLAGYKMTTSKTSKAKAANEEHLQSKALQEELHREINNNFRIYFPTHDSVANSTGGTSSGGTICFQPKWYDAPSFPKTLLRNCKSQRTGLLMHNKVCQPATHPHIPKTN